MEVADGGLHSPISGKKQLHADALSKITSVVKEAYWKVWVRGVLTDRFFPFEVRKDSERRFPSPCTSPKHVAAAVRSHGCGADQPLECFPAPDQPNASTNRLEPAVAERLHVKGEG